MFLGQLLESLPFAQRLLRYRQLSQEALQKATSAKDDDLRAGYLSMAAGWHMLATEIERLRDRRVASEELSSKTATQAEGSDHISRPGAPSGDPAQ